MKYKIIEINYPLNQTIISYIENLFSHFPKEDIFYEIQGNSLKIYLGQIDFTAFKKQLSELTSNENEQILLEILFKIENIKSYGIKGNKRIYVDYNRERKVKNRVLKEKLRNPFFMLKIITFQGKTINCLMNLLVKS